MATKNHCAAGSSTASRSFSLWLGHARVLTPHRGVIHYARAASLPLGGSLGKIRIKTKVNRKETARCRTVVYRKPSPVGKVDATKEQTDEENGIKTTNGEAMNNIFQETKHDCNRPYLLSKSHLLNENLSRFDSPCHRLTLKEVES